MAKLSLGIALVAITALFFIHPKEKVVLKQIGSVVLPKVLQQTPLDSSVIATKTLCLKNVPGSYYNASLIKEKQGYTLIFRYDDQKGHSYLGKTFLNDHWEEQTSFQTIDTQSDQSQDARIFEFNDTQMIIFNDIPSYNPSNRIMRLTRLIGNQALPYHDIDTKLKKMEKNWSPFVYEGELYFEYALNPRKILKLNGLKFIESREKLPWPRCWGKKLRGSTPPLRLGDIYLAFFHSSFKEKAKRWYVMGAYTFEAKPPFRITKISSHPILFEGIYDSPHNPIQKDLYCIYPAGAVVEKDKLYLSCGENDSSIKIVTFDFNKLLQSLKPLP